MYSVLVHSVGVALIIWNFTGDKKQAIAGLLHDISSPAFKHCIDFLNGDAEKQESTEQQTLEVIKKSKEIMSLLKRDEIKLEEISDYKIYPIADNETPKLSADRLEYTFQNGRYFKNIWDLDTIKEMYEDIQRRIFYMIPEKWDKVYLYSSVYEKVDGKSTGELFFYYIPKGIFKKNPINVYEIPQKFNLDEKEYINLVNILYKKIIELREEFKKIEIVSTWTNITMSIEGIKFRVEYDYEDLKKSKFTSYERHIIWRYNNLNIGENQLNKEERKITLDIEIDTELCPVLDYFEIFIDRMIMSKYAAKYLTIWFELIINDTKLL